MTTVDPRVDHMARIGHEALIARAQSDALRAAAEGIRAQQPDDPAAYVQAIADAHTTAADLLDVAATGAGERS